jgi:hypothetical protein
MVFSWLDTARTSCPEIYGLLYFNRRTVGRWKVPRTIDLQRDSNSYQSFEWKRGFGNISVKERLSWAERRETKREEGAASSLLGLFDVHIPLIYGEGRKKAMNRLKLEGNCRGSERDESAFDK